MRPLLQKYNYGAPPKLRSVVAGESMRASAFA